MRDEQSDWRAEQARLAAIAQIDRQIQRNKFGMILCAFLLCYLVYDVFLSPMTPQEAFQAREKRIALYERMGWTPPPPLERPGGYGQPFQEGAPYPQPQSGGALCVDPATGAPIPCFGGR